MIDVGMDGLTQLSEIKRRFADLPGMMVTAYADDERRHRAAEHGAAKFITKDFEHLKRSYASCRRQQNEPSAYRQTSWRRNHDDAAAAII